MVVVKSGNLEDCVEGLPSFLFAKSSTCLSQLKELIANIIDALAMHLAFHFLNLLLLYADLDPAMVHLGNQLVLLGGALNGLVVLELRLLILNVRVVARLRM